MYILGQLPIMVNSGAGIDDAAGTNRAARLNHGSSHNLYARAKIHIRRNPC
jgi:hypothetical protein